MQQKSRDRAEWRSRKSFIEDQEMPETRKESSPVVPSADERKGDAIKLSVRLQPVDHSEQPVFSNFTVVQRAPGMVFVDFGFLEPNVMNTVIRQVRSSQEEPKEIRGQLACRVAMGLDTALQLTQQLNQLLQATRNTPGAGQR
jgi:hypothetical protein